MKLKTNKKFYPSMQSLRKEKRTAIAIAIATAQEKSDFKAQCIAYIPHVTPS